MGVVRCSLGLRDGNGVVVVMGFSGENRVGRGVRLVVSVINEGRV